MIFLARELNLKDLVDKEKLNDILSEAYFAYLPLTAHVQGIKLS